MNNRVQVDDQVTVTDRGEHFQKRGTIKHILGGTLWVHTKQEPRNAGVFVARARAVALQNLLRRTAVQFNQLNTAGVPGMGGMGPPGPMGGRGFGGAGGGRGGFGGGGGRGFGARANMDPLVGKFVRIRGKSEFKGQAGMVRSVKENVVFVDLETGTRPKTVKVDRSAVFEESRDARAGAGGGGGGHSGAGGVGAATPAWAGGRTPMYGAQTPMHGAATPMHGAATPMHQGGQTPSLYQGGQTPSLYNAGGQTPSYGAYTPRHQYE
jgi:transcription elongation factor